MKQLKKFKIKLEGSFYWCYTTKKWITPSLVKQMQKQGFVFEIVE
jgi:hypothetical protein